MVWEPDFEVFTTWTFKMPKVWSGEGYAQLVGLF